MVDTRSLGSGSCSVGRSENFWPLSIPLAGASPNHDPCADADIRNTCGHSALSNEYRRTARFRYIRNIQFRPVFCDRYLQREAWPNILNNKSLPDPLLNFKYVSNFFGKHTPNPNQSVWPSNYFQGREAISPPYTFKGTDIGPREPLGLVAEAIWVGNLLRNS